MSVEVMTWVFKYSDEKLGRRLVLLALADYAHDDGTCAWPSIDNIAGKARLSRRRVQECLRGLEADGAIVETGRTKNGTHIYSVIIEGGADFAPHERGAKSDEGGAVFDRRGARIAPDPLVDPLEDPSREIARAGEATIKLREPPITGKVDRKAVAETEAFLAGEILSEWNHQTGQALTARDFLAKFVMRIREHPELTIEEHAHVIATALADPWWDGVATPSVVYGSGAQFERSMLAVTHPATPRKEPMRYGRGMTTKQILDATRGRP